MRFKEFLESRDHEAIVKALRAKTVERGATAAEAAAAKAKADELEAKHKPQHDGLTDRQKKKRPTWTKADWDAHYDRMERDER